MTARKSKEITKQNDIDYLLSLSEENITASMIMECFGEFNGNSRFKPYDIIEIPIGAYGPEKKKNKNKFTTTIGIWIFNKYFIERDLFDIFQYIPDTINKSKFGKINTTLSYALLEDEITLDVLKKFIMKVQFFMPFVSIISPNHTMEMLTCTKQINKKKEELVKKYQKEINDGNEVVVEKMEKELLDYAKELLKDDPAMDMFNSGARGSIDNNFKNMYVMRGAIKDPDPINGGYNVALSNYSDGISKEDYPILAKSLAAGPYARAKKTELGGYWEKQFLSAFQHIVLLPNGSDCKTTRTIDILLDNDTISNMMYSYIVEGTRLVELTSKNMEKYRGKKVKMRFSSLCESKDGICSKCAGNLFYRIGITNVGVATPIIPSKLKNLSMKSFHDSTVKTVEMDPMRAFGLRK